MEASPWRIIRRRVNPLDELAIRVRHLNMGTTEPVRRITEYRLIQELGPISRGSWIGVDRCDGQYRLIRYRPDQRTRPRGRLISSFSHSKLIRMAWKMGVSNPDGFARTDCDFFGLTDEQGCHHFSSSWKDVSKSVLCNYIWNHLYDSHQIYSYL